MLRWAKPLLEAVTIDQSLTANMDIFGSMINTDQKSVKLPLFAFLSFMIDSFICVLIVLDTTLHFPVLFSIPFESVLLYIYFMPYASIPCIPVHTHFSRYSMCQNDEYLLLYLVSTSRRK